MCVRERYDDDGTKKRIVKINSKPAYVRATAKRSISWPI